MSLSNNIDIDFAAWTAEAEKEFVYNHVSAHNRINLLKALLFAKNSNVSDIDDDVLTHYIELLNS